MQDQQVQEIHDFFQRGENTEEEDGKPKADEISDDNDSESVFSAFCENICLEGDEDELSIAQMCQNMHLAADDDTISFDFL